MSEHRVYSIGGWSQAQSFTVPQEATDLGRRALLWLSTGQGEVDADLSRILFREFQASERFRQTLIEKLRELAEQLRQEAASAAPSRDVPQTAERQYEAGYVDGSCAIAAEAAQRAQSVINEVVYALHEDSEKLAGNGK